jgi:protein-L-isoaspartate(D-aspartate) O-methyltransferase
VKPWDVVVFGDGGARAYRRTPDADPAHLCHNVVVAIDPARNLNNGQPSALATWIAALGGAAAAFSQRAPGASVQVA